MQLSHQWLQFIPTMPVKQHQPLDTPTAQRFSDIRQNGQQGGWHDTQGNRPGNFEVVGIHAKGDKRQLQHLGSRIPGMLAGACRDGFHLKAVDAIGQMQVVRFGSSKRQHCGLPFRIPHHLLVELGEHKRKRLGHGRFVP